MSLSPVIQGTGRLELWDTSQHKIGKKAINAEGIYVSLSPVRQATGRLELWDTSQQKIGKKSINTDETDVFLSPVSELWNKKFQIKIPAEKGTYF